MRSRIDSRLTKTPARTTALVSAMIKANRAVSDTYCSSAELTKLGADLPTSLPGTPVHRLRRMGLFDL
jgi:hypothetical protein